MTRPIANYQVRKKLLSNQRTTEKHGDQIMLSTFGARYEIILFTKNGSFELDVSRFTTHCEDVLNNCLQFGSCCDKLLGRVVCHDCIEYQVGLKGLCSGRLSNKLMA